MVHSSSQGGGGSSEVPRVDGVVVVIAGGLSLGRHVAEGDVLEPVHGVVFGPAGGVQGEHRGRGGARLEDVHLGLVGDEAEGRGIPPSFLQGLAATAAASHQPIQGVQ